MIHYYALNQDQLKKQDADTKEVFWLHIENPTSDELTTISTNYHLPMDYLTAILDDAENSRYEGLEQTIFERAALLLLQYPHALTSSNGYPQYETYPMAIIFTPEKKVLTVSKYPPIFFDELPDVYLQQNDMSVEMNLVLQILWKLVLSFNRYLKKIKLQLSELEGQIKVSTENKQLYQMLDIQKSLVLIESATKNNLATLSDFSEIALLKKNHAVHNHLQDVLIETKQAVTSATIHLRLVSQITDTFSAIVSNNLNNVMKILTSLTLVLTIPTIIGGIYGMNVSLPFANSKGAFWLIAGGTVLLCVLAMRYLKKKNLL